MCQAICLVCALSAPTAASLAARSGDVVRLQPSGPLRAVTQVEGITEYRLANGLQVLLIPDRAKPTVTVNMTYRVGSRHEGLGETGMAHLLEHLLFKGSPRHPQVWAEFNKRGLSANGSTWLDRTNYYASFAANDDNLRWYLNWQADAMVNSFIARKDLDSEMTVVRNEMEMGENSPGRILLEKTLATMYQWHNYGKSTIGARTDVEGVDIANLKAFYQRHYQPDNATLIVSGKFDAARTLGWIEQAFGKLPRPQRKLREPYTLDATQDGERSVTLRRVGGVPMLYAAYHVTPGAHADFAAVSLLSQILGDTPSGRLHHRLTERQLAASVFGFTQGLADPGFIVLGAQLSAQQDSAAARQALLDAIESFATQPVTKEELERARTRWLKDWDALFADPQHVGVALSESVAQGDWRLFFLTRDRIKAVQLADVQRVAERYFVGSNRTVGEYVPTPVPQRAPAPERVTVADQLAGFKAQASQAPVEAFDASPANIDARTVRQVLPSGMQVALLAKPSRGQAVKGALTLRHGTVESLAGWGEAPDALAALLDQGTRTLNRQQLQDRLDALQAEVGFSAGAGQLSVSWSTRREHLPAVIALVAEVLQHPALPAEGLEEIRRQALAGIASQRKEPEAVLEEALSRHGNPYPRGDVRHARTFDETEADWRDLRIERVREFHGQFLSAAHAQLAVVGDLDLPATQEAVKRAFGNWRNDRAFARVPQPWVPVEPVRLLIPTPDKQNAHLSVSLPLALSDRDPDYAALMMANHLLGGGGDSRLWRRIREKDGLSYSVYSAIQWNPLEANSEWVAAAIFAPQNRDKVEQAFREEIQRALKEGFTAAELEAGQRGLLSFRQLGRAQDARLAAAWAANLFMGRDFSVSAKVDEQLGQLTLEQVNQALRRHLQPDRFVIGVAGDFQAKSPAR
ncbi:MAG: insulinase family protein [Burkholderiales bacterium]|nr:insulinase family protein [Burkholderiales bacterium]MBH2016281.1 insulinase family protein [Burkholderiales bacterium]